MSITRYHSPELITRVKEFLINFLYNDQYLSPGELLTQIENRFGMEARWDFKTAISEIAQDNNQTRYIREYLHSILDDGSLEDALRGVSEPDQNMISSIDMLLSQSIQYRTSSSFQEMIDFMGRFRDYAPYNNMLVRIQNPSCGFFATAKDWKRKFNRTIKEDARPMLILVPMHPVMLVYDLDQTEGDDPPEELLRFAQFSGDWRPNYIKNMLENANRHQIRVNFKPLSSTHGGLATIVRDEVWKMRIAVHDGLDDPSRFGVLCHELAHIMLGHLGSDQDRWWPSRYTLEKKVVEIEAEAVAHIVTSRLGLTGFSEVYVSRYLKGESMPAGVSLDFIAKVSGKIERMAQEILPKPRPKVKPTKS